MRPQITLPAEMETQIEVILRELRARAQVECVLLADISGQLINSYGETEFDPVLVAALASGELAAMIELSRQIGNEASDRSFLHEGEKRSLYISSISGTFILIAVFSVNVPVGLVRIFVRRAVERLHPWAAEFEDSVGQSKQLLGADFGSALSEELDTMFEGL